MEGAIIVFFPEELKNYMVPNSGM
uniref:Uncharacterized protein n=1 Tax=Rhizophora mucronata TaxID=61149 RepID=A0A2P2KYU5_RHIMU